MPHPENLKILVLIPHSNLPSSRFRFLQHLNEFKSQDIQLTANEIPKTGKGKKALFNRFPEYDIILLQKKLFNKRLLKQIRKKSEILLYDFDDALMYKSPSESWFDFLKKKARFNATIKCCDYSIAGNDYLKSLSPNHGDRVFVIPTGINTEIYTPANQRETGMPITIGWIGSKPNLVYLQELMEPINQLYSNYDHFILKIVCDNFDISGFNCPIEEKKWNKKEEVADIQSFDIGIMPLSDDKWTKGKCALKLLQYLSCGIASVSTFTTVTDEIIEDGNNGFLAETDEDWVQKLKYLIENHNLRNEIGKRGRSSLIGRLDSKAIVEKYSALFTKSILNRNKSSF